MDQSQKTIRKIDKLSPKVENFLTQLIQNLILIELRESFLKNQIKKEINVQDAYLEILNMGND